MQGYLPSARDQEVLGRTMAEQARHARDPHPETQRARGVLGSAVHEQGQAFWSPLRVIETLAAARIANPEFRQKLMAQAQERLEALRSRGEQGDPLRSPLSAERLSAAKERRR